MTGAPLKNKKIGICHQTVTAGDAIGNDIAGMYDLLESMGLEVRILCELAHPAIEAARHVRMPCEDRECAEYDALIYHHSIHWEKGERWLNAFDGPVVLRYHNITPASFFAPYSALYGERCHRGREQTRRFIKERRHCRWMAASGYNRRELLASGEAMERVSVVPPFNKAEEFLSRPRTDVLPPGAPLRILSVGRVAPHKGHFELLKIVKLLRDTMGRDPRLRIVGACDDETAGYRAFLDSVIRRWGLENRVRLLELEHVSHNKLYELFRTSHVYLCTSQYEGFCLPVVEAQAAGLPVVAANAGAVAETAGPGQLVLPPPRSEEGFLRYAQLVDRVCSDGELRRKVVSGGYRNVMANFTRETVENRFVQSFEPVLRALA